MEENKNNMTPEENNIEEEINQADNISEVEEEINETEESADIEKETPQPTREVKVKKANTYFKKTKVAKIGAFNFAVMLIVLAILIFINLAITVLPSEITSGDMSANKVTTLSDESREYAAGLKNNVTIYMLATDASAQNTGISDITGSAALMYGTELYTFLERFEDANSKIKVVLLDPAENPETVNNYTSSELSECSLIVVSDKRSTIVNAEDLFVYYSEALGQTISTATYQSLYQYEYQYQTYYGMSYCENYYGFSFSDIAPYFDGNTAVTRALEYVSLETVPTVYSVLNHNETEFSSSLTESFKSSNITMDTFELKDGIPEDATAIIMNAPQFDLTTDEADALKTYLSNGGALILMTNVTGTDNMPNLAAIMAEYGLSSIPGTVYDPASNIGNTANYVIPTFSSESDVTAILSDNSISALMPSSHGIAIADTLPDGVTVEKLATTTESAYRTLNDSKVADSTGSYTLAVSATAENGSHIVWCSSAAAFTDQMNYYSSNGNYYLLYNSINWCGDAFESSIPQLETSQIGSAFLTVKSSTATIWLVILAVIIPVTLLSAGIVIWARRRRR